MAGTGTSLKTEHPWRASLAFAFVVVAFPVGVAAIVAAFTHFGRHVEEHLFEMIALILPVVALAAFVERGGVLTLRFGGEGLTTKLKAYTVAHVVIVAGSLVVGECAALYAVATYTATTFLVMTCLVSGVFQVAWLSLNTAARIQADGRDRHASKMRGATARPGTFQG